LHRLLGTLVSQRLPKKLLPEPDSSQKMSGLLWPKWLPITELFRSFAKYCGILERREVKRLAPQVGPLDTTHTSCLTLCKSTASGSDSNPLNSCALARRDLTRVSLPGSPRFSEKTSLSVVYI
jgi:hypothetical protein